MATGRPAAAVPLELVSLDLDETLPLYRSIYEEIRQSILNGRLSLGYRLPSTRVLARTLGVSRNTTVAAYDLLIGEGYLEVTRGGTYVTRQIPDDLLYGRGVLPSGAGSGPQSGTVSQRWHRSLDVAAPLHRPGGSQTVQPFSLHREPFDTFPRSIWNTLASRRGRSNEVNDLDLGDPAGYRPLREVIAGYLATTRSVRCTPEQVVITSGSQQALDILARVLTDPEDRVWIEDPYYHGALGAFIMAGAAIVPVPVDEQGLCVEEGMARAPDARVAFVTPSNQKPMGFTLSLARRMALLDWAYRHNSWIVEDDYDGEFRYGGRPLPSLQGLDRYGRVIYLGSFGKLLYPGLRLGYIVVPESIAKKVIQGRILIDYHSPTMPQGVLTDFITEGHFARHLRRTRLVYAERQAALVAAAREHLDGMLEIVPRETGVHVLAWLPPGVSECAAVAAALEVGVEVTPLSRYRLEQRPDDRQGLLLGHAAFSPDSIRASVRTLAHAFEPLSKAAS